MSASLCPNSSNKDCPQNSWTRFSHSPVGMDANVLIRYIRCDGSNACMDPEGNHNWLTVSHAGKYNVVTTSVPSSGIHATNIPFRIGDGILTNLAVTSDGLVIYNNTSMSNVHIMPVPVNLHKGGDALYYGQPVHLMACIHGTCTYPLTVSNLNSSIFPGGYLAIIPTGSEGKHFKPAQFVLYPAGSQYHCDGTSCVKTAYSEKDLMHFDFSSTQTTLYSQPCPDFVCGHSCTACVNGKCDTTTGKCECSSGYYGDSCQSKLCAAVCQNGGTCNPNTGKCVCPTGFRGPECGEIVTKPVIKQCPDRCVHGICDVTRGVCKCHQGYYGKSCEYSFSCNTPLNPPTGGWKSAACDTDDDCLAISNCNVEGSCLMPTSGYCKSNGTCNFGLGIGKKWSDCPN